MLLTKILQGKQNNVKTIKSLKNQIKYLNSILLDKKKNELVSEYLTHYFDNSEKNIDANTVPAIIYTITVKFALSNSALILSNVKGENLFFYSAGSIQIKGKQKIKRKKIFILLFNHLMSNCPFIKNKPISLHLINTSFHKRYIIKKIMRYCLISFIKIIDATPHNGCRPPKKRRKKFRTKKRK